MRGLPSHSRGLRRSLCGLASLLMTLLAALPQVHAAPVAAQTSSSASVQEPEPPAEQELPPGHGVDLTISLLTFGPGITYWERFGHNAILVRDRATGEALAYNYGVFDFDQENFFLNFARGYMNYLAVADPLDLDLQFYYDEHRRVTEQRLDLSPSQREKLRDFLAWNVAPENAGYRYDYFRSNCSTRVRDALDTALGGRLQRALRAQSTRATYRFDAVRLIAPDLWLALAMDAALGPSADVPLNLWDQSFVPDVLMHALLNVRVQDEQGADVPLIAQQRTLLNGSVAESPVQPPDLRGNLLLTGIAIAIVLLALTMAARYFGARLALAVLASLWLLTCGLGGVILAAMWAFTAHWAGWRNANLLLLDPLCLLLIPSALRALRESWQPSLPMRALAVLIALTALAAPLLLAAGYPQHNLQWILLLLPPQLALAMVFVRGRAP